MGLPGSSPRRFNSSTIHVSCSAMSTNSRNAGSWWDARRAGSKQPQRCSYRTRLTTAQRLLGGTRASMAAYARSVVLRPGLRNGDLRPDRQRLR